MLINVKTHRLEVVAEEVVVPMEILWRKDEEDEVEEGALEVVMGQYLLAEEDLLRNKTKIQIPQLIGFKLEVNILF